MCFWCRQEGVVGCPFFIFFRVFLCSSTSQVYDGFNGRERLEKNQVFDVEFMCCGSFSEGDCDFLCMVCATTTRRRFIGVFPTTYVRPFLLLWVFSSTFPKAGHDEQFVFAKAYPIFDKIQDFKQGVHTFLFVCNRILSCACLEHQRAVHVNPSVFRVTHLYPTVYINKSFLSCCTSSVLRHQPFGFDLPSPSGKRSYL